MPTMEALFNWLAVGFGTLFVVAIVVAWWEHLQRGVRPPAPPAAAPVHVTRVDLPLDTLAPELRGDAAQRRAALDGAIGRMARPPSETDRGQWEPTSPMVLQAAPDPAPTLPPGPPSSRA